MITEFEKGQWSVIQNVITFMEDDQTAMELCREAGFGKKKILELEKDSDTQYIQTHIGIGYRMLKL